LILGSPDIFVNIEPGTLILGSPNIFVNIEPETLILGSPDIFVDQDSTINLTCIVSNTEKHPHKVRYRDITGI